MAISHPSYGVLVKWGNGMMLMIFGSLMVYKRVKQRKDCDYGQQLRFNLIIHTNTKQFNVNVTKNITPKP